MYTPVESSTIKEFAVDGNDLLIKFKNDSVYKYEANQELIEGFRKTESKGKYLNAVIKKQCKVEKCQ